MTPEQLMIMKQRRTQIFDLYMDAKQAALKADAKAQELLSEYCALDYEIALQYKTVIQPTTVGKRKPIKKVKDLSMSQIHELARKLGITIK